MSTAAAIIIESTPLSLSLHESQALQSAVADLSAEQLIWSSGYLAGLAAGKLNPTYSDLNQQGTSQAALPAVGAASEQLTVLYGSQTGNGRALAEKFHQQAVTSGVPAVLQDMADFSVRDIAKLQWVAIVVSTHGEGDAPDDAEMLLEYLQSDRAPQLPRLNYTVLALGDSSYAQFCQTGRDFDQQLEQLGAHRMGQTIECDLDYQVPAATWTDNTIEVAKDAFSESLGDSEQANPGAAPVTLQVVGAPSTYGKDNPFAAKVLLNQKITGERSTKTVQHLELDLTGSGLRYEPGDSLGVVTKNPSVLVDEFLTVLGTAGDVIVDVAEQHMSLREALEKRLEITANSGAFLQRYAELIVNQEFNDWLANNEQKRMLLNDYQIIDVLHQWPLVKGSEGDPADKLMVAPEQARVQVFIDTLRPLSPRVYSISSSALATPEEVHITVAEVAYEKFSRAHWGSASTALARTFSKGDLLDVYVENNPRFRLPEETNTDVIMIGPGTGVAPFRAFVEQRVATQATGRNWLFFGDRNFDEDFLYQTEWQKHLKRGNLHRLDVAFSRDQAQKIYVQDRLIEHGEDVFDWLQQGARIYLCGDATTMAPDVHQALLEIIMQHGQHSADDASQYLKTLKREHRYLRDVY